MRYCALLDRRCDAGDEGGCCPMGRRPNVEAGAITVARNRYVVKRAWNRLAAGGGVGVSGDLDARDGKCGWGQSS